MKEYKGEFLDMVTIKMSDYNELKHKATLYDENMELIDLGKAVELILKTDRVFLNDDSVTDGERKQLLYIDDLRDGGFKLMPIMVWYRKEISK